MDGKQGEEREEADNSISTNQGKKGHHVLAEQKMQEKLLDPRNITAENAIRNKIS